MESLRGSFIVAVPSLKDPNFHRTVVLLCEHNDDGALGLVVNRESQIVARDVLAHIEGLTAREDHLWEGGPVQNESIFILHEDPAFGTSRPVLEGVAFGGDIALLEELVVRGGDAGRFRLYAGYAGWSPEQLEWEIKQGSWIIIPASREDVFTASPAELWGRLLTEKGGDHAIIARAPTNPDLN